MKMLTNEAIIFQVTHIRECVAPHMEADSETEKGSEKEKKEK